MPKNSRNTPRREESLSRDRIVKISIGILDSSGERGLTFRALSERLATGPGAIYWHIDNKDDLLTAACETIVTRAMEAHGKNETPEAAIRTLALGMFDAIDAHPWVGSALTRSPGQQPIVRIVERIGRQVCALGVPDSKRWAAVSTLLHYILGVSGQNAANTKFARERGLNRSDFLEAMSTVWSQLDPDEYPFARSVAGKLRTHDDRVDYLAGIDLILAGICSTRRRRR